jgi:hypothetical protein
MAVTTTNSPVESRNANLNVWQSWAVVAERATYGPLRRLYLAKAPAPEEVQTNRSAQREDRRWE